MSYAAAMTWEMDGFRLVRTRPRGEVGVPAVRQGLPREGGEHRPTAMPGRSWMERDEAIRRFAVWLGFRRASPFIDGATRSVINGLIRDGRLEARGSLIRRTG